ncbi:MAG: phospholipase D-like domain-containing protein [Nitrososphaerales archaeon]
MAAEDAGSVFFDDKIPPQILKVVNSASASVTFVTPYLGLWGHLKNDMEEALLRGVSISFAVRAGEQQKQAQDVKWLREHRVRVHEVENLHAKIYLNERTVLVSSMNIYRSSTIDSRDFAVLVRDEEDARRFRQYVSQITGGLGLAPQSVQAASGAVRATQMAFCIRDASSIPFDTSRPLCEKCYPKWAKYRNNDYEEAYCHSCGKRKETTFAKPLCLDCYKRLHRTLQ